MEVTRADRGEFRQGVRGIAHEVQQVERVEVVLPRRQLLDQRRHVRPEDASHLRIVVFGTTGSKRISDVGMHAQTDPVEL